MSVYNEKTKQGNFQYWIQCVDDMDRRKCVGKFFPKFPQNLIVTLEEFIEVNAWMMNDSKILFSLGGEMGLPVTRGETVENSQRTAICLAIVDTDKSPVLMLLLVFRATYGTEMFDQIEQIISKTTEEGGDAAKAIVHYLETALDQVGTI